MGVSAMVGKEREEIEEEGVEGGGGGFLIFVMGRRDKGSWDCRRR